MEDEYFYSYPDLIARNKNRSYREMINNSGKSFMRFLVNNELILLDPFLENGELKQDLEIFRSNLTAEGAEIFNKPFERWLSYLEKGGDATNFGTLEKALLKIRANEPKIS